MRLREYQTTDAEYISKWMTDDRLHAMWCAGQLPFPFSAEALQSKLNREAAVRTQLSFTAEDEQGVPVGFLNLGIHAEENTGYLSYVIIDRARQGRGYGSQMLILALHRFLVDIGLDAVQLRVFSVNRPALKLYSRAGFKILPENAGVYEFGRESWKRLIMRIEREDFLSG